MDSLRKSFKRNSSQKNVGRKSGGEQESKLILFDDEQDALKSIHPDSDRREVVVKIDNSNGSSRDIELSMEPNSKTWKGSYDFLNDGNDTEQQQKQQQQQTDTDEEFFFQQQSFNGDIPKLIAQFQEKEAVGKTSRNVELEMEAALMDQLPPVNEDPKEQQPITSKELRVSFQAPSLHHNENGPENIRRRSRCLWDEDNNNNNKYPDAGEVLKCSANSSFKHNSSLMRSKTKSRLIDPPLTEDNLQHSGINLSKSLKSGMLGKDDDDDDPFLDEDLPGEFKKGKLSALTILEWLSFIAILVTFICTLKIPFLTEIEAWNLSLWRWEVLVLVLISGRLVSGWGIRIIVFFIERNFLLRKRVLYFVYALRNVVLNCLWLGLVLITWTIIFNEKDEGQIKSKVLPYITKILICLLVGTLIWLVKTILVKVLASSFHVSTYFDRIQDSLFNQYVIETLSGPPLVEIQNTKEEEGRLMDEIQRLQNAGAEIPPNLKAAAFPGKSMQAIGSGGYQKSEVIGKSFKLSGAGSKQLDEGITIDHLHKLNQKNISAWNMKRLMRIVRRGSLSTLDEHISNRAAEDDSAVQIESEYEAKAAAKRIFTNVAKHGSKYIHLADLMCFMREDEAVKTMGLFEGASESNRVNKTALKDWVVNAFRERRALSLTLNDTKTAVNKLHQMVNIVVGIIILVISLLILEIATTQLLVVISSQLLLVVFIFGNTCKTIFEAIIFLFVMHPYDVGDRCEINGVQMIVEEMNILTTVFLRYDNQKIIYPNSVLSTQPISNYYRSPDMGEAIEFCVHVSTSVEKIGLMRERLIACIEGKKEHWYPNPMVVIKDVIDMNKLQVAVWPRHRMNHQNMGERWARRACLVEEMVKIFRELDIEFRMLPVDVNLRTMPESSSRLPSTWTTCA
ncbi:hypothetical protein AAC387_Pa11g1245 [Persea americana]